MNFFPQPRRGCAAHPPTRHKREPNYPKAMSLSPQTAQDRFREGRRALLLVFLLMAMPLASFVPGASASHITQYAVQRDPSDIAVGDLDCDGDNDIVSASAMGHFITTKVPLRLSLTYTCLDIQMYYAVPQLRAVCRRRLLCKRAESPENSKAEIQSK